MADGFATTCAISTYHHYYNCEFAGVLDVIKFVSEEKVIVIHQLPPKPDDDVQM
jgi:hypothetical protein